MASPIQSYISALNASNQSHADLINSGNYTGDSDGNLYTVDASTGTNVPWVNPNPAPTLPPGFIQGVTNENAQQFYGDQGSNQVYDQTGNLVPGMTVAQLQQDTSNIQQEQAGRQASNNGRFDFNSLLVPALMAAFSGGTSALAGGGFGAAGVASSIFGSGAPAALTASADSIPMAAQPEDFFGDTPTSGGAGQAATLGTSAAGTVNALPGQAGFGQTASDFMSQLGTGTPTPQQQQSPNPEASPTGAPPPSSTQPPAPVTEGALTSKNSVMQMLANGSAPDAILAALRGSSVGGMLGVGGGTGAMPWGSPGNLASLGTGVYGLYQAQQLKKMATMAQQNANPWQASGGTALAGGQLQGLLNNPSSITSMPGYQAGLTAVQRSLAAQGYNGSGNMMAALSQYGGNFYNNAVQQLGTLAGAPGNSAAASSIGVQGNLGSANLAINSLGLLGKTAASAGSFF